MSDIHSCLEDLDWSASALSECRIRNAKNILRIKGWDVRSDRCNVPFKLSLTDLETGKTLGVDGTTSFWARAFLKLAWVNAHFRDASHEDSSTLSSTHLLEHTPLDLDFIACHIVNIPSSVMRILRTLRRITTIRFIYLLEKVVLITLALDPLM